MGLPVDNLIEADVVLADGSFVTASETENADLLWALRGGGGNFGVVTSFVFRTNPAKMVYGGPIIFEMSEAATVMRWYREFQKTAPDDFYIFLGLQTVPATAPFPEEHWNKRMCVLLVSHNGEGGRSRGQQDPRRTAETDYRLVRPDALHRPAGAVRPVLPQGHAVVLEGRLRPGPARRRDRRPHRARDQRQRLLLHASLSDRWRRAAAAKRRDSLEHARCDMVDGDCSRRSRAGGRDRDQGLGQGVLVGRAPLQPCRAPTRTS